MSVRLRGSTSGYAEIDAPAVAGNNTLILPGGNGTADQVLSGNGSGTLSWVDRGRMTLATAQNTTSGTAIDFTGIPSWVKRVTVMFNGVSTNGTSGYLIQLGAGSIDTTATYINSSGAIINSPSYGSASQTTGFGITGTGPDAAGLYGGSAIITLLGSNAWVMQSCIGAALNARIFFSGGSKSLSGTLDRIRITTVNGTDTFDAGSVNLLLEG